MKHFRLFIGIYLMGLAPLIAQSFWGDYHFVNQHYPKAVRAYQQTATPLTIEQQRFYAKALLKVGDLAAAVEAYTPVANDKEATVEDYYRYADLLTKERALASEYRSKAYNLPWATPSLLDNDSLGYNLRFKSTSPYKINGLKSNTDDNEFGLVFLNNKPTAEVLYLSDQKKLKGQSRALRRLKTDLPIYNFYKGKLNRNELNIIGEGEISMAVNSFFQEGPGSYSPKQKEFYFSRSAKRFKKNTTVQINSYRIKEKDLESNTLAQELPFNLEGSSTLHPAISADGMRLYFASDRPGGYGGMDLYYVDIRNGQFSTPYNLGPDINTDADEVFPFVLRDKFLFFSSNRKEGLGQLDIYLAEHIIEKRWETFILGQGINSEKDDFTFGIDQALELGYFASDRTGGQGADDLYAFPFTPEISGLEDQYIYIPSDTLVVATQGVLVNDIEQLEQKDPLQRLIEKEAMLSTLPKAGELTFNANGSFWYKNNQPLIKKDSFAYRLKTQKGESKEIWVQLARAEVDKEELSEELSETFSSIYFNLAKSNILETYLDRVEKVVEMMRKYPTLEIEVSSYTDCRGSAEYNLGLSAARTQAILDYVQERISKPERIYGKGYGEQQEDGMTGKDYQLIAGSYRDSANVERLMQQLAANGYSPSMTTVGEVTRVVVVEADAISVLENKQAELNGLGLEAWISENPCIGISEEEHQKNRRTDFRVIRR